MVRLTEVEDEHFSEKPSSTSGEALLVDDDGDYTDTDSSLSDDDDFPPSAEPDESLTDRILALKDIIPPSTRTRVASAFSSISRTTSSGIGYGGRGLWIICTSVLLFGMPYALAFGAEQEMMEEERQRALMSEGASAMIDGGAGGQGEGKAAL